MSRLGLPSNQLPVKQSQLPPVSALTAAHGARRPGRPAGGGRGPSQGEGTPLQPLLCSHRLQARTPRRRGRGAWGFGKSALIAPQPGPPAPLCTPSGAPPSLLSLGLALPRANRSAASLSFPAALGCDHAAARTGCSGLRRGRREAGRSEAGAPRTRLREGRGQRARALSRQPGTARRGARPPRGRLPPARWPPGPRRAPIRTPAGPEPAPQPP